MVEVLAAVIVASPGRRSVVEVVVAVLVAVVVGMRASRGQVAVDVDDLGQEPGDDPANTPGDVTLSISLDVARRGDNKK